MPSPSSSQDATLSSTNKNQTEPALETASRKRKLSLDINTLSQFNSPTKQRLCRRVIELENTIKIKDQKIKKIRDSNRFMKKRIQKLDCTPFQKRHIKSLKSLLSELENKYLISTENVAVLNALGVKCSEIVMRQMILLNSGKIVKKKLSPELKTFALTLNFYSTKAYNYVRKNFNTCLPSVKTLGKWYCSVDGHPGFTKESLETLRIKAEQSDAPIYCSIIFDEMKIRNKIEKTFGYVDFGCTVDSDCNDECTEVLVYFVVPLNGKWKLPIGYFFINKLTADQKVFLLTQAIEHCNKANVIIKAVTFDGCPANISMAKKLGCKLDPDNLKPFFKVNNTVIAVFFDPSHMIQLVRNSFEQYRCLKNKQGDDIAWSHIERLLEMQEQEMFHAANKLPAEKIFFRKNILKIRLATQLFSNSVAAALMFCKKNLKLPKFRHVEGTNDFLLILNDLFDILDSTVHGYELKRALNKENAEEVLTILDTCKNYLMNLTVTLKNQQTRLVDSPRCIGFLGLCVCIESLKYLFNDLIKNDKCRSIPFHRISQDHLELFFCHVRSHGGLNNNLTAKQFYDIYKKMLVHTESQDYTGNCSSAVKRINITTVRGEDKWEEEEPVEDISLDELEVLSQFSDSITDYISGAVVTYLIKSIKCNTCVKALVSNDENKASLISLRDKGRPIHPSKTVTKICWLCERVIRRMKSDTQNEKICYKDKLRLITQTLKSFVNEDLFPEIYRHQFDYEDCNHVIELAKSVMEKYIDIKLLYNRKIDSKAAVRRVYNKLKHLENQ